MLINLLLGLAATFAILATIHFLRPASFRITRTALMNAEPAAIFEQVNDFHKWEAWSPWAKIDPLAKNSFEGPTSGLGAIFRWDGNKEVGAGNMTITESRPHDLILIRLEFLKPFAAVNTTEFTFTKEGSQTHVSWSMYGKNNFMGKVISMFINCDKMVGKMFDKGLASMKTIVETK